MKIYVASSLFNRQNVKAVMNKIIESGHQITYDWTAHGKVERSQKELMQEICDAEVKGVKECDALLLLSPSRTGSHVELGIAIALDKPIFLHIEDSEFKSFYMHKSVVYISSNQNDVVERCINYYQ